MKTSEATQEISRTQAVILDMDGVITQTAAVHARAWKQMFDNFLQKRQAIDSKVYEPLDIGRDYTQYIDGKPRYDGVRSFLESRGISLPEGSPDDSPDQETVCGLGNRKNQIFNELVEKEGVKVYADTVECIRQWHEEGLRIAVISASKNCEAILKAAGLTDLFDVRVDGQLSAQLGLKGKPAPDIFLQAAKELGVEPAQTVVIEDAIAGVEAAKKGGFSRIVGIARHAEADALRGHGAHLVVNSLSELRGGSRPDTTTPQSASLPDALQEWDQLQSVISRKKLAIFFDYDGTLTPIVKRPEDAVLSKEMQSLLKRLSKLCMVAVVSGRDRADVETRVGIPHLVYAGSHGFDITGPNGLHMQHEDGDRFLADLDAAEQQLIQQLGAVQGAMVDRKKYAIAVHYRNVSGKYVSHVLETVNKIAQKRKGLKTGPGKMVMELKPDIDWHKGRAVEWLLNALNLSDKDVVPMYIGDDITDEDAFRYVQDKGIGVLVGHHGQATAAHYLLENVSKVKQFLKQLINYLEQSDPAKTNG